MKNLIYQVWAGELRPGCNYSQKLFKKYAKNINADYRLDIDPNIASKICDVPMYFEWLNPILDDSFLEYDNVLVVDMDVFPVAGLKQNIFEEFTKDRIYDCGICTEPFQGKYRASFTIGGHINMANDEKWNSAVKKKWQIDMPRDSDNYLKVYNAGMVMFSKNGLMRARDKFPGFQVYIDYMRTKGIGRFYTVDQNYFHAMMVRYLDYLEMDNGWNSYIHYTRGPLGLTEPIYNSKTKDTKFVHIQLSGADYFSNDQIHKIVNYSQSKWDLEGSVVAHEGLSI